MMDFYTVFFPTFFIALIVSAFLTPVLTARLRAAAILDQPNERSSHVVPTPRGGGLALIAVIVPGLLLGLAGNGMPTRPLYLLLAITLLAGVSWLDDKKGASIGLRLLAQILAVLLGLQALPPTPILPFLPWGAERALIGFGWLWFINLTNFMDGIDGLTGLETLFLVATLALTFLLLDWQDPADIMLLALLGGAMVGFLPFNWPPARVFLGDVGSVPIGFMLAYFLLLIAPERPITAFILPLYYLADSTITLLRRALRGEKIWQPHREHFYQRAAARFGHRVAVLWIAMGNAGLGLSAFLFYNHVYVGLAGAIIVVAFLLFALHKLGPK
jgi:UDP-N-acetylmuramyl pentapeptide phosphotransferase/UDP-N-acetylglucosamine-1-phosphate transferase